MIKINMLAHSQGLTPGFLRNRQSKNIKDARPLENVPFPPVETGWIFEGTGRREA